MYDTLSQAAATRSRKGKALAGYRDPADLLANRTMLMSIKGSKADTAQAERPMPQPVRKSA